MAHQPAYVVLDIETTGPVMPVNTGEGDVCFAIGYACARNGKLLCSGKICLDFSTVGNVPSYTLQLQPVGNAPYNLSFVSQRPDVQSAISSIKGLQNRVVRHGRVGMLASYAQTHRAWDALWRVMRWDSSTFEKFWGTYDNLGTLHGMAQDGFKDGRSEKDMMQELVDVLDNIDKEFGGYVIVTDNVMFDIPWITFLLAKYMMRPLNMSCSGRRINACSLNDLTFGNMWVMPAENAGTRRKAIRATHTCNTSKMVDHSAYRRHDPEFDAILCLERLFFIERRCSHMRVSS